MSIKGATRAVLIAIAVFQVMTANLHAATATVHVKARVLPWIAMNATQHKGSYEVTPDDLNRNFIDLPVATSIHVDTNVSIVILTFNNEGQDRILASLNGQNTFDNRLEIALTEQEKSTNRLSREFDIRVLLDADSQTGRNMLATWISVQGY